MADHNGNRERWLVCLLGLILTFGTVICYWPVRHFEYINLDDTLYVYENRNVLQGLTWPGFIWAFQSCSGGNWNPLVWLTHMADSQIYGAAAGGHHFTNLLFHAANALVLFLVLKNLTGAVWRSAFAAAIFAWHPLHVESVAWVSERKDVLSTLFWLLTIGVYTGYVKRHKESDSKVWVFYALTLLCFVLGLMSKPMLVTLPFVLLLLDFWPLKRTESSSALFDFHVWKKLILEKIPFFVLSLGGCVLAVWAQGRSDAIGNVPTILRLKNAAVSYLIYLEKFFWPTKLAIFYPYPLTIPFWQVVLALGIIGAVTWFAIIELKSRGYLGVGWLWFLGTLVPVIGFLQVGLQSRADRYTYVPYIGLAVIVSWGLGELAALLPRARMAFAAVAMLTLGSALVTTRTQLNYWHDNTALYEHAMKVTKDNPVAHNNLGYVLMDAGKLDEAIAQFREVIRLKPFMGQPYSDLGKAFALQNKIDDAMIMFSNAVTLNPGLAQAHWNLGSAYLLKGRVAEAITEMKAGVKLSPDDVEASQKFGDALIKMGKPDQALPYCEKVVKALPKDAHARFSLANAYLRLHQPVNAISELKEAIRQAPNNPQCMNSLAWIYATNPQAQVRNGAEAVRLATNACEITKHQNASFLDTLATAYAEAGQFDNAIKTAQEFRALAESTHDDVGFDIATQRLGLFKAGKPFRDE